MHRTQKLFCHVARFCNLVVEFNGLVSKQGQQQCWPFYMPVNAAFQRFSSFMDLDFFPLIIVDFTQNFIISFDAFFY